MKALIKTITLPCCRTNETFFSQQFPPPLICSSDVFSHTCAPWWLERGGTWWQSVAETVFVIGWEVTTVVLSTMIGCNDKGRFFLTNVLSTVFFFRFAPHVYHLIHIIIQLLSRPRYKNQKIYHKLGCVCLMSWCLEYFILKLITVAIFFCWQIVNVCHIIMESERGLLEAV